MTYTEAKRLYKKQLNADLKTVIPQVRKLKKQGFVSSGWFNFAVKSRHWKKTGELVYIEVRDINKAKLLCIPEIYSE